MPRNVKESGLRRPLFLPAEAIEAGTLSSLLVCASSSSMCREHLEQS